MMLTSTPQLILPDAALNDTRTLYNLFVLAKLRARRSPKTLEKYRSYIEPLASFSPQLPLSPDDVERYLTRWSELSDDTYLGAYTVLSGFYKWLVVRGYLSGELNPFRRVERPSWREKVPRYLTAVQLRSVIRASRPPVERVLILVLIDCGPRIGELVGLTKDHLRDDALMVAPGKSGERVVPLSHSTAQYLESLSTHCLFPSKGVVDKRGFSISRAERPLAVSGLNRQVRRVIRRAGFTGPKSGPHLLRHSFATNFIAAGGDTITLAKILGHGSTRMTERYVSLSLAGIKDKHREHSVMDMVMGLVPAVPEKDLPEIPLPSEVSDVELVNGGNSVYLMLTEDRRPNHVYYYIRARAGSGRDSGSSRWTVCSLGTDLPLDVVDGYRSAIHRENSRRDSSRVS